MRMEKTNEKLITCFFVVLLIPFLSISGIRNAMGTTVYQLWQTASVLCLAFFVFTAAAEIKLNWAVGLFVLYQSVILLSSFIHQGFSAGILTVTAAAILLFMLLQSRYCYTIVRAACVIVILCTVINLPFMLPKLNDVNAEFFIGGKNALSMFFVPGSFLLLLNNLNTAVAINKKTFLIIGLCLVSIFLGSSGTGTVVAVLAVAFMALAAKVKPKKWVYILIILLFYALFILFFEDFFATKQWLAFTEWLGKDNTLTSRTTIWRIAKEIIGENWLFGSGRGTAISYLNTWGERQTIYEAHNFILEILMEGGAVALAIYATLFAKAVRHLDMDNAKNKIIFVALCILLINGLTESTLNHFFVIIILGIACRYAVENRGRNKFNEQQI